MARKNNKGTSFCSLSLETHEENVLKKFLRDKRWSAKRYIRFLIRSDLNLNVKLKNNGK